MSQNIAARYMGKVAKVLDTESHRSREMVKLQIDNSTGWVFTDDENLELSAEGAEGDV